MGAGTPMMLPCASPKCCRSELESWFSSLHACGVAYRGGVWEELLSERRWDVPVGMFGGVVVDMLSKEEFVLAMLIDLSARSAISVCCMLA